MTLATTIEDSGAGSHFELFATIHGSAVSVMPFDLVPSEVLTGLTPLREVVSLTRQGQVIGVVDGFDAFLRPVGGIRFRTDLDLGDATDLFVTREADGETDPAPSRDVVLECELGPGARGTRSCALLLTSDKSFVQGTATLVLDGDGVNPL